MDKWSKRLLFLSILHLSSQKPATSTNDQEVNLNKKYGLALEAIFGMGIRLQVLLDTNNNDTVKKNFVVSPLSATALIGQLMLGAEGEFREELYELLSLPKMANHKFTINHYGKGKNETYTIPYFHLHLQLSSLLKELERSDMVKKLFTLKQKSALFISDKITLKPRFQKDLQTFYDSDIFNVDFTSNSLQSQKKINLWASQQTNGLIDNLLPSPPAASTSSMFLNAVYFLAEWETPFSDTLNKNDSFSIAENETVETTYMQGFVEQIRYAETDKYRLVALPYRDNELGMYIMLPHADHEHKFNIGKFAETLTAKEVMTTIAKAKIEDVVLKIPKLSLSNSISILKPLQKYKEFKSQNSNETTGNKDALDTLADKLQAFKNYTTSQKLDIFLEGAAENTTLKISDIVQEMVFNVNEKGTEAAAVTAGIIDYIGGSKLFLLNRPFVFFIRHEQTSVSLFWGTISNPTLN